MANTSTILNDLRVFTAEQFVESVSEPLPNTKIYLAYGKTDPWPDDNNPNESNCSISTTYEIWSNMIGGKRLLGGDLHHVIPRYDWESGDTYFAYTHFENGLCDNELPFYVMTDQYNVYKCIANNKGQPSTEKPTSTSADTLDQRADGYVWKYMYTIPDSEQLRFTTPNYIPVKTLKEDDGSLQWGVQEAAIPGAIHYIEVTNGGSGYSNASNITVTLTGDGTGFVASANLVGNSIGNIIITNTGRNYTYAQITLSDSGAVPTSNAVLKPIISPPGGHGSDPLYELFGKNLLIDARLKYDEEGVLPTVNDYRQISLLKDPISRSTANIATISAYLQATKITCLASVNNYQADEIVYQGGSLATATFKGRVLSWTANTSELKVINTDGTVIPQKPIIGSESQTVRQANTTIRGTLEPYSGKLLYVDNIKPVIRSADQIENFKIVLKF